MLWLNDWVFQVAKNQKQVFSNLDYEVLASREISKKEHLFLIKRLSEQLTSISEMLTFFGCVDAAQKIDEAIEEIAKVEESEMPVVNRRKQDANPKNSNVKGKSGAKIFELHESRSS